MDHVLINENIPLESSNPNQNYQHQNWDAPPGSTSHSRATAQTGAQSRILFKNNDYYLKLS